MADIYDIIFEKALNAFSSPDINKIRIRFSKTNFSQHEFNTLNCFLYAHNIETISHSDSYIILKRVDKKTAQ